ncbi:hypothetical protein XELAEV_18034902mg, partial [Xenopus laevis]
VCGKCSRTPALLGCGVALMSVSSLAFSLLLYLSTSALQSRVSVLEKQRVAQLSAIVSTDQMEAAILGRVDQLLEEKLKSHLPRLREVRDTSAKCFCPPGKELFHQYHVIGVVVLLLLLKTVKYKIEMLLACS